MSLESHLREVGEDYYETIINSSDFGALKSIAFEFFDESDKLKETAGRKHTLVKFLKKNKAQKTKIIAKLLELEANRPFEYIYLTKWTGDFSALTSLFEQGQKFDSGSFKNYFKTSHISYVKAGTGNFVFTLEHNIQSTRWIWKPNGDHSPREIDVRHPIVFNFFENGNLFVSYPGVTKSRNHQERFLSYQYLESIFGQLISDYSLNFTPMNLKSAVDMLLDARKKSGVKFLNLKFGNMDGNVELDSGDDTDHSVEDILPDLMSKYLPSVPLEEIRNALVSALKDCQLSKAHIYWESEKVSTLFNYCTLGTEVSFIWRRTQPSYDRVATVLKKVIQLSKSFDNKSALVDVFFNAPDKKYYTFDDLIALTGYEKVDLWNKLSALCGSGMIKIVYKINSEVPLREIDNKWTSNVARLKKTFTGTDGTIISGIDEKNILVAFISSASGAE